MKSSAVLLDKNFTRVPSWDVPDARHGSSKTSNNAPPAYDSCGNSTSSLPSTRRARSCATGRSAATASFHECGAVLTSGALLSSNTWNQPSASGAGTPSPGSAPPADVVTDVAKGTASASHVATSAQSAVYREPSSGQAHVYPFAVDGSFTHVPVLHGCNAEQ